MRKSYMESVFTGGDDKDQTHTIEFIFCFLTIGHLGGGGSVAKIITSAKLLLYFRPAIS